MTASRPGPDPCVAETSGIQGPVRHYVDSNGSLTGSGAPGAVASLSERSGVAESTIWHVYRGDHRTTEVRIADALLGAIGRPDLFQLLQVRPNPAARPEVRRRCRRCGGPPRSRLDELLDDSIRRML